MSSIIEVDVRQRRWESLTGAIGIALIFVVLFAPGPPPKASDSSARLMALLIDRRALLVGGVLGAGLGVMALLWFLGVLGARLNERNDAGAACPIIVVAGGGTGITLLFVGILIFAGTAFRAASMGDPGVVRVAVDTGNMFIEASKYGFAVMIFAICAAAPRRELLASRAVVAGYVAAVILVVSTFPPFLVTHGIGQFGGGVDVIGALPGFVWLIVLSISMVGKATEPPAGLVAEQRW